MSMTELNGNVTRVNGSHQGATEVCDHSMSGDEATLHQIREEITAARERAEAARRRASTPAEPLRELLRREIERSRDELAQEERRHEDLLADIRETAQREANRILAAANPVGEQHVE